MSKNQLFNSIWENASNDIYEIASNDFSNSQ